MPEDDQYENVPTEFVSLRDHHEVVEELRDRIRSAIARAQKEGTFPSVPPGQTPIGRKVIRIVEGVSARKPEAHRLVCLWHGRVATEENVSAAAKDD